MIANALLILEYFKILVNISLIPTTHIRHNKIIFMITLV